MSQAFLILIPAHNEAQTIATVVSKCRNFSSDVLVIDDGSVDGTGSLASAAGAQVLRTAQCKGYGAALQLGFEECKKLQSKIVVTLDGDGTHDPEFVPSLINFHLDTQANLTIGSRFLTPRLAQAVPDAKAAANFFATALFNSVTGSSFTDVASGMRAIDRSALDLECNATTFGFTYKYLAAARRRGMRIVETGISVHYDAETLLSTNRTELTDFLASVVSIADGTNRRLRDALHEMCELVSAARVLRVCADGKHIIAHPIAHIDAYLFQFQDPCFLRQERQRNWIDWTSINARE
jgi:glycosyltransferase involved in cell wall biosynthesis